MAEDYADKVFTPDSKSDPRADPRARKDLDSIQNPPARETYPGGAGTPEQQKAARGKAPKANGNA